MLLMLRRTIHGLTMSLLLLALPAATMADNALTSPNNSATVLQPSPTNTVQNSADQTSSASAAYLNGELVGGEQSPQPSSSATPASPWGDIILAGVLTLALLVLVVFWRRIRRVSIASSATEPTPAVTTKKTTTKSKTKTKARRK